MWIHVANPNTSEGMTATIAEAARRAAAPGTEIVASTSRSGPASIEGPREGAADAHVVACFDDTGLDAARRVAAGPVVGIGEAACLLATQVAERFVIVTAAPISVPVLEGNLRRNGLGSACAGVVAAGIGVLDIKGDADPVERAARAAAADFPDAAIVLGCAGMAALAGQLTREVERPVIDGVGAAVVLAEGLARLGHATSRSGGWPRPTAPSPT